MLIQHVGSDRGCQLLYDGCTISIAVIIYRKGVEAKIIDLAFIYRGIIGRTLRETAAEIIAVRTEYGWYQHVQVA